ncbi:TetR/AcrR family transcriptional regulator [Terrarubrum flagellatum]|uniref:TetR/AcrR family transcriptional regulator n=1 Tax=Terrirubrum flagellatum TaxID=2895980 RepID=UPI00314548C3
MTDRLSAKDWLDQGLKTLTARGFTALKADPLAKAMGVSRGSFYWHFADVEAFHAALLNHWRDVATERIIAELETESRGGEALARLIRRAFGARLKTEMAVRNWAAHEPLARKVVASIDQRRLSYIVRLFEKSGSPPSRAQASAQVLYWAFLGFTLSERAISRKQRQALIDELLRIATGSA